MFLTTSPEPRDLDEMGILYQRLSSRHVELYIGF